MKDKVTSIIISVVENGYLVNPHSIKFGPCSGVQGPLYVYNNLGDLQRQLPALLGAAEEPPAPGKDHPFVNIDINGRHCRCLEGLISYQEIVNLAATSWGPKALHTITYSRGKHYEGTLPRSGSVIRGESITVSEGLLIGAVVTDAA